MEVFDIDISYNFCGRRLKRLQEEEEEEEVEGEGEIWLALPLTLLL